MSYENKPTYSVQMVQSSVASYGAQVNSAYSASPSSSIDAAWARQLSDSSNYSTSSENSSPPKTRCCTRGCGNRCVLNKGSQQPIQSMW